MTGSNQGVVPWAAMQKVFEAAISTGRAEVAGAVEALRVAAVGGVARVEVPDKLAPVGCYAPGVDRPVLGVWQRLGKAGAAEIRAAREIIRVVAMAHEAAPNIPAIDYTRIRVDGGKLPDARMGAAAPLADDARRYQAWVAAVEALPSRARALGGMPVVNVVVEVLVGGTTPSRIDERLGVRKGRASETVVRELKRYAKGYVLTGAGVGA